MKKTMIDFLALVVGPALIGWSVGVSIDPIIFWPVVGAMSILGAVWCALYLQVIQPRLK